MMSESRAFGPPQPVAPPSDGIGKMRLTRPAPSEER
jgi:hypothetical protein